MQITIEMIETKEFKTKPRGYDPQEVDEFLDAICDEMARQLDEIQSLQQQLAAAKAARPAPAPAPAPVTEAPTQQIKPVVARPAAVPDSDFREILEMAQKVKNETIAAAEADVAVFKAVYEKYKSAPEITRTRLLIETLENVLSGADRLYLVDGDTGTTKLLDLNGLPASTAGAAAAAGGE